MKNKIKIFIIILIILMVSLVLILNKKNTYSDTITYKGKTYVYLETNMDVFNYEFNSNDYYEMDMIYQIYHDKWDMIYFDGDLFVYEKEAKKAIEYYRDDNNYEWSVIIEEDEIENEFPILVSDKELKYLYDMDNTKKEETMLFEEIEKFGTLKKTSKDKTMYAIICLAKFKDNWYYRTGTIDINDENDPEYVIKLPESLNKKIKDLEGEL